MNFITAISRLKVGEATKTPAMGGYIRKVEYSSTAHPEVASRLVFKNKSGTEEECAVLKNGDFDQILTPMNQVLDPALLTQIVKGDWVIVSAEEAEAARINPVIW